MNTGMNTEMGIFCKILCFCWTGARLTQCFRYKGNLTVLARVPLILG